MSPSRPDRYGDMLCFCHDWWFCGIFQSLWLELVSWSYKRGLGIIIDVKFCTRDLIIVASQLLYDKSLLESEETNWKRFDVKQPLISTLNLIHTSTRRHENGRVLLSCPSRVLRIYSTSCFYSFDPVFCSCEMCSAYPEAATPVPCASDMSRLIPQVLHTRTHTHWRLACDERDFSRLKLISCLLFSEVELFNLFLSGCIFIPVTKQRWPPLHRW